MSSTDDFYMMERFFFGCQLSGEDGAGDEWKRLLLCDFDGGNIPGKLTRNLKMIVSKMSSSRGPFFGSLLVFWGVSSHLLFLFFFYVTGSEFPRSRFLNFTTH